MRESPILVALKLGKEDLLRKLEKVLSNLDKDPVREMIEIDSDFSKFLESQGSRTTKENLALIESISKRRKKNQSDLRKYSGQQISKWLGLKHDLQWDIQVLQIEINRIESRKEWPR